jgi:hypothetical protein
LTVQLIGLCSKPLDYRVRTVVPQHFLQKYVSSAMKLAFQGVNFRVPNCSNTRVRTSSVKKIQEGPDPFLTGKGERGGEGKARWEGKNGKVSECIEVDQK